MQMYLLGLIAAFFVTIATVPVVIVLARKWGFVDKPDQRKVHKGNMPRIGGIAMMLGVAAGVAVLWPQLGETRDDMIFLIGGALVLAIVGLVDDRFALGAKTKLIGQTIAAVCAASSGLRIEFIQIPFIGNWEFGYLSFLVTVIWILAVINSVNLIDGLDGLAAGVTTIAVLTMLIMAIGHPIAYASVIVLSLSLLGSTTGFLLYNFYPGKIFMGDTGSMFLGYAMAIISMMGLFKSVTMFSLIVPLLILAVPFIDTTFAVIRRTLNQQSIGTPDKGHLHHCLLAMGYGHRKTVLIIYGISLLFGAVAVLFSQTANWVSLVLLVVILFGIFVFAEGIGLIGQKRKPLLKALEKMQLVKKYE
ncbi:glycosyltransferase family 4 protein [Alkalicoccobacillus plakortidis]|uniref:Undecaprenyl/decaprenyl-phosphate alpha-N-acetylglucosaminyl 1-phosphate transferase n=1 Tax=Alkalicoccobacillus plakortidis TaxID=444060 RepID=A0ABT0XK20_9BACI|nr:MraY family glycosyltransferase [Alkalicoccobacillus plakortidis]MCM2675718.1 undecaprenyl/decaprenyl-phosphate alpha-N-acetylglucosaminyl 1-phosphate transferase [Alkalicoccobacillus plakortidis]